jgi:peptide deformylase
VILDIQTGTDNPILRKKSKSISRFDKKLKKLIKDMTETMLKKDGIGLAASQIGINERLVILNFQIDAKKYQSIALINPEIIDASIETAVAEEGCLSLPKIFGKVRRYQNTTIKFQDENSNVRVLELEGLNARAMQHEIDHCDGILFIDKVEGEVREDK